MFMCLCLRFSLVISVCLLFVLQYRSKCTISRSHLRFACISSEALTRWITQITCIPRCCPPQKQPESERDTALRTNPLLHSNNSRTRSSSNSHDNNLPQQLMQLYRFLGLDSSIFSFLHCTRHFLQLTLRQSWGHTKYHISCIHPNQPM